MLDDLPLARAARSAPAAWVCGIISAWGGVGRRRNGWFLQYSPLVSYMRFIAFVGNRIVARVAVPEPIVIIWLVLVVFWWLRCLILLCAVTRVLWRSTLPRRACLVLQRPPAPTNARPHPLAPARAHPLRFTDAPHTHKHTHTHTSTHTHTHRKTQSHTNTQQHT